MSLAMVISTANAAGINKKTTRRNLRVSPDVTAFRPDTSVTAIDSAHLDKIRLSGFDKPLRSPYETLFVTNGTALRLTEIEIDCDYTDTSGRQLHHRRVRLKCMIPPGHTRQVSFRSWDRQQSFHYRLSARPKRVAATAFDVKCTVVSAMTTKP